jgi:PKD repeat protein
VAEIDKEIEVNSTLRPEIFILPVATSWGNPINFLVKSNQDLVNYEWNFQDGDTRIIQADKITHTYKKANVYVVSLKVSGADGMTNEVSKTVFV